MSVRVLFAAEDRARASAERLLRGGFEASLQRQPFAGEDDDEDHAWALVTDAPDPMVELLAEEYEGWVEHDLPPAAHPHRPLDLPLAPRRRHGGSERPVR